MKHFYALLAEKARAHPARPFLIEDGTVFTYEAFLRRVDALADAAPLRAGDAALVLAETFSAQAAAFFAAQKAGARPILLHHGLSEAETEAIARTNGLQGLWRVGETDGAYERFDAPRAFVDADDCLGVLTSGSTGAPKALYRTYESWAGFFPVQNEIFGVGADARLFLHGSLSFTGNLNAFLAALYAGAAAVTSTRASARAWAARLREARADVLYLVPAKLRLLAAALSEPLPHVRSLFTGSQLVSEKLLARMAARFPKARFVLYYGASELNYITYAVLDAAAPKPPENLGRPFPGVSLSVRDGRVYVDTPYHVSGVETPFTVGDAGRVGADGELLFFGRGEAWVNKGGFKISCARVEAILRALPGVDEAVVLPFADEKRGEELAAFLVPEDGADEKAVRRALYGALRPVETPGRVVFLPALPLNDRGKPDKARLWAAAEMKPERAQIFS